MECEGNGSRTEFRITAEVHDAIVRHVEQRLPYESGGIVTATAQLQEMRFVPIESMLLSSTRYIASAPLLVRAVLTAYRQGAKVVCTVHSHPHGVAHPSARDFADAYAYDDMIHLIAGFYNGVTAIRAFQYAPIMDGHFTAVPVDLTRVDSKEFPPQ